MLRKYILDPSYVLQPQSVELNEDLTFEEEPVAIVDYQVRQLRSKVIPMVEVLWRSNNMEEHTWETEAEMWAMYPYLFFSIIFVLSFFEIRGRISVRGEDCNDPKFSCFKMDIFQLKFWPHVTLSFLLLSGVFFSFFLT